MKYLKEYENSIRHMAASCILLLVLLLLTGAAECGKLFLPLFSYMQEKEAGMGGVLYDSIKGMLPVCYYGREEKRPSGEAEITVLHNGETEEGSCEEEEDTTDGNGLLTASGELPDEAEVLEALNMEELMRQENEAAACFVPAVKVAEYDWEALTSYETLLSTFYAIDSYAQAGSDLFNLQALNEKDLTLEKNPDAPQILIYHTHSKETYADSTPGDASETIVGVGEVLAEILREDYGYNVLHHTAEYDTVRDEAYAKSLPEVEALLKENPTIEVVIDLHRDSGNPNRDMVLDIGGRKTARFMFFNGISRSKKTGEISYLYNENLAENLAFSFQMQKKAGEYYPGLTRKIYIKQYRYNMHLVGRTLLIELGDENNTVEEAKNACYPIAHLLDMVLSGNEQ